MMVVFAPLLMNVPANGMVAGAFTWVVPIEGVAGVRVGAVLAATAIEKFCCDVLPARSVAWTVTLSVGVSPRAGFQVIRPEVGSIVMPAGDWINWNVAASVPGAVATWHV